MTTLQPTGNVVDSGGAIPAYAILVVQAEGESIHEGLQAAGWSVIHHTNNPLPWLDDLLNLLTINSIVVSPAVVKQADIYGDDIAKCISLLPTYMALEDTVWLELSVEADGE